MMPKRSRQEDCKVCCSKFTNVKRKPVECLACHKAVCADCLKRYLLTQADANCMFCRRMLPYSFLKQHLDEQFLSKELEKHYDKVLAQLEKSLLGETAKNLDKLTAAARVSKLESNLYSINECAEQASSVAECVLMFDDVGLLSKYACGKLLSIKLSNVTNAQDALDEFKASMTAWFDDAPFDPLDWKLPPSSMLQCFEPGNKNEFLRQDIIDLFLMIHRGFMRQFSETQSLIDKLKNVGVGGKVVRCPQENCLGYLSDGLCGKCHQQHCTRCLQKTTTTSTASEHACDPDLLKTLALLEVSTKPCPRCNQAISKIEGCNQMFCTSCKTAFDWVSGTIIMGNIHNPHYFEWLTRAAATEEVVRCDEDELLSPDVIRRFLMMLEKDPIDLGWYNTFFRQVLMIMQDMKEMAADARGLVEGRNRLYRNLFDPVRRYEHLRVDLLNGRLTEQEWFEKLCKQRRLTLIGQEEVQLFDAVCMMMHEAFTQTLSILDDPSKRLVSSVCAVKYDGCIDEAYLDVFVERVVKIIDYYNKHMTIISRRYPKDGKKLYLFIKSPSKLMVSARLTSMSFYRNLYLYRLINDTPLDGRGVMFFERRFMSSNDLPINFEQHLCCWFSSKYRASDDDDVEYLPREVGHVKLLKHVLRKYAACFTDDMCAAYKSPRETSLAKGLVELLKHVMNDPELQFDFSARIEKDIDYHIKHGLRLDVLDRVKEVVLGFMHMLGEALHEMVPGLAALQFERDEPSGVQLDSSVVIVGCVHDMSVVVDYLAKFHFVQCLTDKYANKQPPKVCSYASLMILLCTDDGTLQRAVSRLDADIQHYMKDLERFAPVTEEMRQEYMKVSTDKAKYLLKHMFSKEASVVNGDLLKTFTLGHTVLELPVWLECLLNVTKEPHYMLTKYSSFFFRKDMFKARIDGVECSVYEAILVPFVAQADTMKTSVLEGRLESLLELLPRPFEVKAVSKLLKDKFKTFTEPAKTQKEQVLRRAMLSYLTFH